MAKALGREGRIHPFRLLSDVSVLDHVVPDELTFRAVPPVLQLYLDAFSHHDPADFALDDAWDR